LVNDLVAGVCLAAVIAAIISSIGAQTLKIVSAISSDVLKSKSVNVSRITIFVVMAIASAIAVIRPASIMNLVSFAWSGVGAGFGPVLLASLYFKKVTKQACIYGMSSSTILVVLSAILGVAGNVTAIAFTLNLSVILIVSTLKPADAELQKKFANLNNEKV
jgi:Na+/proline symporter